jgi:ABC-2 type transport system ATP-binding protein
MMQTLDTNSPTVAASQDGDAAAISIRGLSHKYPPSKPRRSSRSRMPVVVHPDRLALDNVDLDIAPQQIFGILGPNGGGKTTLFRILATLLQPTAGDVRVFGDDPIATPHLVRQHLGVVFQNPSLDIKLTARENLTHQGHLYGLSGATLRDRIGHALEAVRLADRADHRVEHFSGGMRRRVEIAKSMLHRPRLLLLDEPSTGLDPASRRDVWLQLNNLRREFGISIALTTHLMEEADHCDQLAILSEGKLVATGTPGELKATVGGDMITVAPELEEGEDLSAAVESLRRSITDQWSPWPQGKQPQVIEGAVRFEHADGPAFIAKLTEALPGRIRSVTVGRPTLEDVFMLRTGRGL